MEINTINFTLIEKLYYNNKHYAYKTLVNDIISTIPLDPANTDYIAIQEWIKEGGEVIDNPPSDTSSKQIYSVGSSAGSGVFPSSSHFKYS